MGIKHTLDARIYSLATELNTLKATRTADIKAAHLFTAADYRIKLVTDYDGGHTLEDIMGVPAGEGDSPSVFEYQARLEAIFNGTSSEEIWAYGIIVEERDPETGEFDELESTWGFYYLSGDSWQTFEKDTLLDAASNMLPEGINVADVEIIRD